MIDGPHGLPRLLAGLPADGSAITRSDHERLHGPLPHLEATALMDELERSGLRGRGGADFPTARKLRTVAAGRGPKAVVVNASEGEPASQKDKLLLARLPHLVIDGAVLAAEAIGAREVIFQIRGDAPEAISGMRGAVAVRSGDPAKLRIVEGPGGYVAGEESAVMHFLNDGDPRPTFVPPRPYERGYRGRPTLVQNPETLAQVALIARYGAAWFRELGTHADPGSVLVTIIGAVTWPGVYELAFGTPMTELLAAAGGPAEPLQALLVGGYFGTWVDAARLAAITLAREELRMVGCALGSGVLFALGESACGLHESSRVARYLAGESAGQCGPCVYGLDAIAGGMEDLAAGVAPPDERHRILRWATEIRGRGACHHPDGAARFVESALEVFADDLDSHTHGWCGALPAGLPVGEHVAGAPRSARAGGARR